MRAIKNIITVMLIVLLAGGTSCSDMNELADRFLDKGATVYAARVDSAIVYSGYKQVEIEMFVSTQRINTVKITWDYGKGQAEFTVGNQPGIYKAVIENLEENEYVFKLISIDSYLNESLPVEVTGSAFGDNYLQSRIGRSILRVDAEGTDGVITWNPTTLMMEDLVYSEVRYTTTSGEQAIVRILPEETKLICPNAKRDVPFEYRSAFLPPNGVGATGVEWKTYILPFPRDMVLCTKTGWSIVSFSDQMTAEPASRIIDNNYTNWWSSDYFTFPPCPHWAIIDMQNPIEIGRLVTQRRDVFNNGSATSADTKAIEYYLSNDPDPNAATWTKIAAGNTWENHKSTLDVVNPIFGRYLKLVVTESNRLELISIVEVDVYRFE
jgi:hypothetical protein